MYRLSISIFCPGMPFDGDTINTKSLGGSETACVYMAKELRRLGHKVYVFCETKRPGEYDRVIYNPIGAWKQFVVTVPHDVQIVQRTPDIFFTQNLARINLVWCHDLALARQADTFRSALWNVDRVMTVSEFMTDQYRQTYGLPEEVMWTTRNGLDLSIIPPATPLEKRDRKLLVYSARPERGLDVLLDKVLPELLRRDPEYKLLLFGYDNFPEHMRPFYEGLVEKSKAFGDRVRHGGFLPKKGLYEAYSEAGAYVYPTPSPTMPNFREVSCISAMEAQACGLPMVTSALGALPETLKGGVLIDGNSTSDEYVGKFCDAVLRLQDDAFYTELSETGRKHAAGLGWGKVAEEWSRKFEEILAQNNDSPIRLTRHFIKRSDIMAAKEVVETLEGAEAEEIKADLTKHYGFIDDPEAFKRHYVEMGRETDARLGSGPDPVQMFQATDEKRFHLLEQRLGAHPEIRNVLEFGCGHGWSTVYLGNKVGKKWVGVDIDPGAIKWASYYASKYAQNPEQMEFLEGDHTIDLSKHAPFDCLLISEVLEHCPDPAAVLQALEKWVRPGGWVFITTPYGPVEFGSYNWEHFRGHLWEFDEHDLTDLMGHKPAFDIQAAAILANAFSTDVIGFYFLCYQADHRSIGKIDMERKLNLQRPRKTLGVSMICGAGVEETLGWCLNSLKYLPDEIVIADCGMSEEAKAIAAKHGARIIPGSNPLIHGFETPRNEALAHCRTDFCLWIDSDEKLIGGANLPRYLRDNIWHGYSIRQHHFSVDAQFRPDLPVRVFRTRPWKTDKGEYKKLKYVGLLHEHPETDVNEGPGSVLVLPDVHIAHVGYLAEMGRRIKFKRNYPLLLKDQEKYPDRLLQKHFIMRDNMLLVDYELQSNGMVVTDNVRRLCRETIDLFRKHFLGKPKMQEIDSLQYYSHALEVLGEGIAVAYGFDAQRGGVGDEIKPNGAGKRVAIFASADEAEAEIMHSLREKIGKFKGEYW